MKKKTLNYKKIRARREYCLNDQDKNTKVDTIPKIWTHWHTHYIIIEFQSSNMIFLLTTRNYNGGYSSWKNDSKLNLIPEPKESPQPDWVRITMVVRLAG